MPTSWESMSVANLRAVAKQYKSLHNLGNISKQPKTTLVETLKKVMEWKSEKLYTKKEHGGKMIDTYSKPAEKKKEEPKKASAKPAEKKKEEPKKASAKPAEKKKEEPKKAKVPAPPPQPPKKADDKSYKKSVVAKKVVQARGASADAKAIAPPKMEKEKPKTVSQNIQSLPPELQNEIFKKLPKKLQDEALTGTDEEKGIKFIKDKLPKTKITTIKSAEDFIYELMEHDGQFETGHYEENDERVSNLLEQEYYESGEQIDRFSEEKMDRYRKSREDKIFKFMMKSYKTILQESKKQKLSPAKTYERLRDFDIEF